MSYNILNKNVNFQGDTQGTIEDVVDTHSTQTINGFKTITNLTGTSVRVTNNITALGNISASVNISASAFYGDGSTLSNIGTVSFDGSTANGMLTYKDADEASVESTLTYDGSSKTLTLATSGAPTGVFALHGTLSGSGNISGSIFYGDGSGLSNISGGSIALKANGGITDSSGLALDSGAGSPAGGLDKTADKFLIFDNNASNAVKTVSAANILAHGEVTTYNGQTEHRVLTSGGSNVIDGEQNLTFDGSTLTVTGVVSGSSGITGSIGLFSTRVEAGLISLGDASGLAGAGLANSSGQLDIQVSGAIKLASDKVGITGSIAGVGLSFDGGADSLSEIKFDPGSLPDTAMTVADDYIVFLDGGASGDPKKEQWADVINNVAHTGLDASGGRLSVDVSDFMTNGVDNRLITATGADAMNAEANLSFYGSTLAVTGTLATRDTSNNSRILESVVGASGSILLLRYKEIAHTCTTSGTSEDINDFFTPGMIPFALGIRVTTAITRGDASSPHITKIGVVNDDDAFGVFTDNALEQSGDNLVTAYHPANSTGQNCKYFTTNHELRITYNAQPAAGAIRLGLYYYDITAPTS